MVKEEIYDEKISPLMKSIIDTCRVNKIDFFATFNLDIAEDDYFTCDTRVSQNESQKQKFDILDAVNQCFNHHNTFDVDKFIFFLIENYNTEGSLFLNKHNKN